VADQESAQPLEFVGIQLLRRRTLPSVRDIHQKRRKFALAGDNIEGSPHLVTYGCHHNRASPIVLCHLGDKAPNVRANAFSARE